MTTNFVHLSRNTNNNDLTQLVTSSVTLPARALILVAVIGRANAGVTCPTVTLAGGGLVWTEVKTLLFDTNAARISLFAAMTGKTAVTTTLTATWSATVRGAAYVIDYGPDAGPILRVATAFTAAAAASLSVPYGVTTAAGNIAYGVFGITRADRNMAPQAGWTELGEQPVNSVGLRTQDIQTQYFNGVEADATSSISPGTTQWGGIAIEVAERVVHARGHKVFSSDHLDVDAADVPAVGDVLVWDGTRWIASKSAIGYYEESAAPVVTDADFPSVQPNGSFAVTHNTTTGEDLVWFKSAGQWSSIVVGESSPPVVPGGPFAIGSSTDPLTGEPDNWGLSCHRVAWWNSYKSRWEAILPLTVAAGAPTEGDWHIVAGVTGNSPTIKNLVDGRTNARPDIVWDNAAKKLYVVMHGATGGGLCYVYTYNETSDVYTLVRPATATGLNFSGSDSGSTFGRMPNGHLWVAGNDGTNGLRVNRSSDDGATWGTPFQLQTTTAQGKTGISWFINGGVTHILIFTAENGIEAVNAKFYSWRMPQDTAAWNSIGSWTNESASLPALVQNEYEADDEVSITKDASHNIYVTAETEVLDDINNPPQWILYKRTPSGVWSQFVLHQDVTGESARKRPVVTVDDSNQKVYVFAQVAPEERIVVKSAPLAALGNLENGSAGETTVFVETGKTFRNTHSPANVTSESDLLVIADQRLDKIPYWNLIAIP